MRFAGLETTQVNDGLNQTAACAAAAVYDKADGLMFVSYMTGIRRDYGESTGRLCMSVFPPSQPGNIRFRTVDEGVGASRGLLCTAHALIGARRTRMWFTTTRGEKAAYFRDYDFDTDTVSPRRELFLRTDAGDVRLDNASYRAYLASRGFRAESGAEPIVNKVSRFGDALLTAVTLDDRSYPVLCEIRGDVLVPFAVCPAETTYEFRYYRDGAGTFRAVYRVPPDDHGTGHCGYAVSSDGGKSWETSVFEDGIQSRPDILPYKGRPLIVYNYLPAQPDGDFPPMHNHRNAVKFVWDGRVILDLYSKYGIVEHETVPVCGDLYMAFSCCPQGLSVENGKAWIEEGRPVEQGKEALMWTKLEL